MTTSDNVTAQAQPKGMRRTSFIAVISITLFIIGILSYTHVLNFYFHALGNHLFDRVIQISNVNLRTRFACDLKPFTDPGSQALLQSAETQLLRAIRFNAADSQAYLLLARANCLLGNFEKAIQYYQTYTHLRPANPLGHLELGLAYDQLCGNTKDGKTHQISCSPELINDTILQEWHLAGIAQSSVLGRAEDAYTANDFEEAFLWFRRNTRFSTDLTQPDLFKWGISAIMTNQELPEAVKKVIKPIPLFGPTTRVEGQELRWLKDISGMHLVYGDPLNKFPSGDPSVGVMWWEGEAIIVVQSVCQKPYEVVLRVRHTNIDANRRGKLELNHDFKPVSEITLPEEWHEYSNTIDIQNGLNIIGVKYVQDVGDAVIGWIEFRESGSCAR